MQDDGEDDVFDQEELESLYEDDAERLTPEDVFKLVTINRVRKVKTRTEITDTDGNTVDMVDLIQQLMTYMKDKVSSHEANQFSDRILPMLAQTMGSFLGRFLGIPKAAFYLAVPDTRDAFQYSMALGLLLYKTVKDKNWTIHTYEEDLTDEELEEIERKSAANNVATLAALSGHNAREVLREMVNQGKLTEKDLKDILGSSDSEEDDDKS